MDDRITADYDSNDSPIVQLGKHIASERLIAHMFDTKYVPTTEKWVREPEGKPVSVLPPERIEEIKVFAAKLHKKHPHMKPNRLKRKVAEYFKIKLV